jgi:hypothetical protein
MNICKDWGSTYNYIFKGPQDEKEKEENKKYEPLCSSSTPKR